jgi:FMN hydrolase / 5-amino-6-(5-phospho-D-ribitylamino)uracil phosphatase
VIRAVAFDVMDTLLTDPFRQALAAATGLELGEVLERRPAGAYPAFERGEIDEDAYWAAYATVGIEADRDTFHRVRVANLAWIPGMREVVDDLEALVLRTTASNYPVWIEELAAGPLAGRFDLVLASHHLGIRKPEAGFYERLTARLALPSGSIAFVDDRPVNVEAARPPGLPAHLFEDATGLRTWLRELGVALPR